MSLIDCIKKVGSIDQEDIDQMVSTKDQYVEQGFTEENAEKLAVRDFGKRINDEMNKLRKSLEVPEEQVSGLNTDDILQLQDVDIESLQDRIAEPVRFQKLLSDQDALQEAVKNAPNFYSNSLQSIANVSQGKATVEQWKAMLLKNGANQAELDWIGFDQEFKGKKPTKEEVYDFIQSNEIEVVDVVKGDVPDQDISVIQEDLERISEKYGVNAYIEENVMDGSPFLDVEYDGMGIWMNGYVENEDLPEDFDYESLQKELDPIHKKFEYWDDGIPTKYGQYTLPGGENYKELLLTMPGKKKLSYNDWKGMREWHGKTNNSFEDYQQFAEGHNDVYTSSHWDEANILSHIRFNERSVNGEKTLFIEEIQSDWAQEGRKKGWKSGPTGGVDQDIESWILNNEIGREDDALTDTLMDRYNFNSDEDLGPQIDREYDSQRNGITLTPFKNTSQWLNLSMRRMIRYASENGFDRIAWVTGDQSAERYDLSKQVDSLEITRNNVKSIQDALGTYSIDAYKDGGKVISKHVNSQSEMEEIVGKEITKDFFSKERVKPKKYEGQDLKVGGEGMKSFYNKIVPNTTSKLLRKLDKSAKVEVVDFGSNKRSYDEIQEMLQNYEKYPTDSEERIALRKEQETAPDTGHDSFKGQQLSFPITPLIRQKAIQEGMPLFQKTVPVSEDPILERARGDNMRVALQDRHLYLKRLIETKDRNIDEKLDAYNYDNLSKGIINDLIEKFKANHVRPLEKHIKSLVDNYGVTYDEVQRYLKAKHIVDDQIEEGGIPIPQAQKIVRAFKLKVKDKDVKQFEKLTQDINQFVLQRQFETGMITKERFDALQKNFKFYVPLRGFAAAMDVDDTVFTKDVVRKGRTSESGDPLPYLFAMAQTAIQKGQQNLVKQRMLEFVKEYPDSRLYNIKNVWYAKIGDNWEVFTQRPPKEIFDKYEVKRSVPVEDMTPEQYADFKAKSNFGKESVTALVEGKRVVIEFVGEGAKVGRAFNNSDVDQIPKALQWLGGYTRQLTKFYTQYSPEFAIRNLVRDMTTGLINVRNDLGSKTAMQVMSEVPTSMATLYGFVKKNDYKFTKALSPLKKWSDMDKQEQLQEFIENGSQTGYSDLKNVNTYADEMKRTLGALKGNKVAWTKEMLEKAFSPIDKANRMFENTVRFSAYKVLRDRGVRPEKAAMYAKDLTVNFNRKGNWSSTLGTFYLFFNAGTQGVERLLRPFGLDVKNPTPEQKKTRMRAYSTILTLGSLGMALQVMNRVLGGKDEDDEYYYDKLPDYTRTHNILIPNILSDKKGDFFQIPLPYGYNTFFAVPDHMLRTFFGKEQPHEAALKSFAVLTESFSPMGAPNLDGDLANATIEYLMPTILSPIHQIQMNKNFAGYPVYKEPYPGETPRPDSQMYYKNVNAGIRTITDALNSATGGDSETSGWVDINPEKIEHVIQGYGGGAFQFADNTIASFINITQGKNPLSYEDDLIKKTPFIRNYTTAPSSNHAQSKFYENYRDVKAKSDIYERYLSKDRTRAKEYRQEHLDKIKLERTAKNYKKKIDRIRDKKKALESKGEDVKNLNEMLDNMYIEFNSLYNGKKSNPMRELFGI